MSSQLRGFRDRLLDEPQADILAAFVLLALSALYAGLTWARFPLSDDKYWYMQVAARVAGGEVLYRDVAWIYGPLPVYVLGLLYRLFRVDVITFLLLGQILATLACLLTYRAARFLLPVPLALLSTMVLFLAGPARFLVYIYPYTGAVSLGATLGLLFVVCLLFYLKSQRAIWLIAAGVATGGAFLTKPEFALACTGTGTLFLVGITLFPTGFESHRSRGIRALGVYVTSTAMVAGIGYGVQAYQAGAANVWDSLSGYGLSLGIQLSAPWGTTRSWIYIIAGLGVCLLGTVILVSILAPAMIKKHIVLLCILAGLSLVLIVLPWGVLFLSAARQSSSVPPPSLTLLFREGAHVLWAPGTLIATILIIALGVRWLRAYRRRQIISRVEQYYTVLLVYSVLVAARFYFNPTISLLPHYVSTLFPVLVFSIVVLAPQSLERWGQTGLRRSRMQIFLAAVLSMYAAAGFIWDAKTLSSWNLELVTPRGTVLIPSNFSRSWIEAFQYVISHTESEDSIVVLGANPEFYFLSGCKNPLRQDYLKPFLGFSSADAEEVIQRLQTRQPRLIIIPPSIVNFSISAGVDGKNLMSVWQYIHDHYHLRTVIGSEREKFAVYESFVLSR